MRPRLSWGAGSPKTGDPARAEDSCMRPRLSWGAGSPKTGDPARAEKCWVPLRMIAACCTHAQALAQPAGIPWSRCEPPPTSPAPSNIHGESAIRTSIQRSDGILKAERISARGSFGRKAGRRASGGALSRGHRFGSLIAMVLIRISSVQLIIRRRRNRPFGSRLCAGPAPYGAGRWCRTSYSGSNSARMRIATARTSCWGGGWCGGSGTRSRWCPAPRRPPGRGACARGHDHKDLCV